MSALLTIEGLRVDFALRSGTVHAVRGADLDVGAGEVVALVGESGSGKSVTAAAVLGLLPPNARVTGGSIRFNGTELVGLSDRRLNAYRGSGIGMIFQNPVTSLDPSFTIASQLTDTARLHLKVSSAEARTVAADWLGRVGIRDPERVLGAYPHELSGGMRQRVMIALASLSGPALLIADEPTTALDATVQKQILDLLLTLTGETGTSVLLITHDFGVVSYASSRVAVMNQGAVVEFGATGSVLSEPRHAYTRDLIDSVPEIGQRHRAASTGRRLKAGTWSGDGGEPALPDAPPAGPARPVVATAGPARPVPTAPTTPRGTDSAGPILEITELTKEFVVGGVGTGARRSFLTAVDGVSFELRKGEVFGLIGESGSGKSTLARAAGALTPLTSGVVRFHGEDITAAGREDRLGFRRRFQYVFQDATTALNPRVRVGDQIARPLLRLKKAANRAEAAALTAGALERVGLDRRFADRYPREFSGGQRQRVSIARAIALEPDLLILDEPTSALDVSTQAHILNLLLDLKDELDLTYLFIGHNLAVIEFLCDRIGVLEQGALLEVFDAGDLFGAERHPSTRALLESVLPVHRGARPAPAFPADAARDPLSRPSPRG